MTEEDRSALIAAAVPAGPATWVELGSGRGVFTATLARRLGAGARIVSIDRDAAALRHQRAAMAASHPAVRVEPVVADLTDANLMEASDLGAAAGVLAANALHYLTPEQRAALLAPVRQALQARIGSPEGRLVVIEYDTTRANPWVPYPLPHRRLQHEAAGAGFVSCRVVAHAHGNFGRGIYAALCLAT